MVDSGHIWEGVYRSFIEVPIEGSGFDDETWIGNSLNKITALRDEAEKNVPLPPTSNYREALLPFLAGMVYNEHRGVRILDFGGGIGFTYYQTIYGLPRAENVEYHIVERESVWQAGMQFFGTTYNKLFFHSQLPQTERAFDIVHSGSALQYIEDWKQLISQLCVIAKICIAC